MTLTRVQFDSEILLFQSKNPDWAHLKQRNIPSSTHKDKDKNIFYLKKQYTFHIGFPSIILLDIYIVYSDSYQVPVLYFSPIIITEDFDFSGIATLDQIYPVVFNGGEEHTGTYDSGSVSLGVRHSLFNIIFSFYFTFLGKSN